MADHVQCPRCSKSIIPVEKQVVVWEKGVPKQHLIPWSVSGVSGFLMLTGGLSLLGLYHVSSVGLAGGMTAVLGCFVLGNMLHRYINKMRKRQHQLVCPHCKHHWIGHLGIERTTEGLEHYFTNVEDLRTEFATLVATPRFSRHLLVIHGVGGVGKSSLLRMFRLYCRRSGTPVALCSGDEARSLVDILSGWAKELIEQGTGLPKFTRTLNEYRTLQKKVEEHATTQHKRQKEGEASKTALKIAVNTAGSLAGIIPGAGLLGIPLSIVLGGTGDTLVDWLHRFLNKREVDLFLDPTDELTEVFLNDLADVLNQERGAKANRRIVLLLDTIEQIAAMTRWLCRFAQQLHPDVLLVFAGRSIPDWEQQWPGWTTHARVEELKPMTVEVMRQLIRNYYKTQREGEPNPLQMEAIVDFARGLPMAVTSIVQLWVRYGVEDFHTVRAQVVADLVEHLTRGIPEHARPILKAAAVLRWFNKELLSVVTGELTLSDEVYEELRRFPIVRSRKEGLALHDAVREYLDDSLRVHEPARHREMHQHAAVYFEKQLPLVEGEQVADLALEALYHTMMANEEGGIKQYRKVAEELVRYQLVDQFRTLLNDVHNYPLQRVSSRLWRQYYRARLRDLEGRQAEAVPLYQEIATNPQAENLLRIYALCDWAWIERYTSVEKTASILEQVHLLAPTPDDWAEPDAKLGLYLLEMGETYKYLGRSSDALAYLQRARSFYEKIGDLYGLVFISDRLKLFYLDQGTWKAALEMQQEGLQKVANLKGEQQRSYLEAELLGGISIGWMWAGRYHETEANLRKALRLAERFERTQQQIYFLRDLALVVGLQGKKLEAEQYFKQGIELARNQRDPLYEAITHSFQGIVALKWTGVEEAEQYITQILDTLEEVKHKWWFPTVLNLIGTLDERKNIYQKAAQEYRACLDLRLLGQWYWHTGALTGLARVLYTTGEHETLIPIMQEAEALAQQYEYNDHLASLRLMQGHLIWNDQAMEKGERFTAVLHSYQQALIYALRYNRFLLDEVLAGRLHGSPFQAIIPCCLKQDEEGRRMLTSLRNWWQTDFNDIGPTRVDTVSLVPQGVSLQISEDVARRKEPGDGTAQQTVIEQLNCTLASFHDE
ncbi:MAG TPA: hypothetical protein VFV38_06620 [Ktedonobacteraceae bacterium]|nr:hypothetical protein [Ktedonobacteraceae bacterium]